MEEVNSQALLQTTQERTTEAKTHLVAPEETTVLVAIKMASGTTTITTMEVAVSNTTNRIIAEETIIRASKISLQLGKLHKVLSQCRTLMLEKINGTILGTLRSKMSRTRRAIEVVSSLRAISSSKGN